MTLVEPVRTGGRCQPICVGRYEVVSLVAGSLTKRLSLACGGAVAFLVIGALTGAVAPAEPVGLLTIGTTEPIRGYLEPYLREFNLAHDNARVQCVSDGAVDGPSRSADPRPPSPVDVVLMPSPPGDADGTSLRRAGFRVVGSFDAAFVPVVSPFSPIVKLTPADVASIYLRRGVRADRDANGEDWKDRLELVTYEGNPADFLMLERVAPYDRVFPDAAKAATYISRNPAAIGLFPLAQKAPGVNALPIVPCLPSSGNTPYLTRRILVLEPVRRLPLLPGPVRDWAKAVGGGYHLLDAFLDLLHHEDRALSPGGAGTFTLAAVGDVMLDRGVGSIMRKRGVRYPFEATREILGQADIAFANLESPISSRGQCINMFRARPEVVDGLVYSGIDVVSVANNHVLDYGDPALFDTISILNANHIRPAGAGENLSAARRPVILQVCGVKVAFLAYTELWFCYTRTMRRYDATESSAGVAPLLEDYVADDVRRARREADVVVVSFHWGREYEHEPTKTQRRSAHLAVDAAPP